MLPTQCRDSAENILLLMLLCIYPPLVVLTPLACGRGLRRGGGRGGEGAGACVGRVGGERECESVSDAGLITGTRPPRSIIAYCSLAFLPSRLMMHLPIKATATAGNKARRKSCRTIVKGGGEAVACVRVIEQARVSFVVGATTRASRHARRESRALACGLCGCVQSLFVWWWGGSQSRTRHNKDGGLHHALSTPGTTTTTRRTSRSSTACMMHAREASFSFLFLARPSSPPQILEGRNSSTTTSPFLSPS